MKRLLTFLMALLFAGCGPPTTYHDVETGYQGKARVDPYLAATRLLQHFGYSTRDEPAWIKPDWNTSVLIIPCSSLTNQSVIREISEWVGAGGHLICLGERSESYHDDWKPFYDSKEDEDFPEPFKAWLQYYNVDLEASGKGRVDDVKVGRENLKVTLETTHVLNRGKEKDQRFISFPVGDGRITVLMDAQPLRNRYIDNDDNSRFLLSLAAWTGGKGGVLIIRGMSISFFDLLWEHGWTVILGLAVLVGLWLWKNLPTFGPKLAPEERNTLRSYDHHLEALGDFHWRLDRAAGLLRPLRDSIVERAQPRYAATSVDGDIFAWIGQHVDLPADRVQRAMTLETPRDQSTFTRLLADLQTIHLSLS